MQGARVSRSEAYFFVGRSDANGAQRRIWAFFNSPSLRHVENLYPHRRLELESFLRQSRIDGNIGKFQCGGIAHNIIETYLHNIKIAFINCKINGIAGGCLFLRVQNEQIITVFV